MTTLLRAIQLVAEELGRYDDFTATAAASGTDADHKVIASSWIDDELETTSPQSGWLYCVTGNVHGEQARVRQNGLAPTTGTFTVTSGFSAIPANAARWLYLAVLPHHRRGGITGLRECINEGLAAWSYRDEIPMVGVSNQYAYPLTSLPWLGEYGRIVDVLDTGMFLTSNPMPTWRDWRVRQDAGGQQMLEISSPYAAGETFKLAVRRAANTYIKIGSVWTETTVGLVDDTDEADVEEQVIKVFGLWKAYSALARLGVPQERAVWEPLARKYAASATQIKESREQAFARPWMRLGAVGGHWAKGWVPGG